jgi:hypothetical protein
LVLTSRREQYAAAVEKANVLTAAAAIELTDLNLADAGEYLHRTMRQTTSRWTPVLAELDGTGGDNLTAVLATPLMITLARTAYGAADRDPAVLLDTDRFASTAAVEDHLLDSFVPTVYRHPPADPPRWDARRIEGWLGNLATDLNQAGTRDLEWWQMSNFVGRSARALITGLIAALVMTSVDLIAERVITAILTARHETGDTLSYSVLISLVVGLLAGATFGLVNGLEAGRGIPVLQPVRFEARLIHRRREVAARFLSRLAMGLGGGLAFGFAFGMFGALAVGVTSPGPLRLGSVIKLGVTDGIVFALLVGLGLGIVSGLIAGFEAPLDTARAVSPKDTLTANRRAVLMQAVVWLPVLGLVIGFGPMALNPLLEPILGPLAWPLPAAVEWGLVAVVGGGLSYLLSLTAWGQWLLFSRFLLPLRRRLPWAVLAFLDDAYRRGVLRQAGAAYQFRHARLQDRLARRTLNNRIPPGRHGVHISAARENPPTSNTAHQQATATQGQES